MIKDSRVRKNNYVNGFSSLFEFITNQTRRLIETIFVRSVVALLARHGFNDDFRMMAILLMIGVNVSIIEVINIILRMYIF
jgi:hypothetical protein